MKEALRQGIWLLVVTALVAAGGACSDDGGVTSADGAVNGDTINNADAAINTADAAVNDADAAVNDADAAVNDAGGGADMSGDLPARDGPQGSCPASEPQVGTPCTTPKLQCGYGTNAGCGDVYECFEGTWALAFDGATCGSTTLCPSSKPSGFCTSGAPSCRYGAEVCTCVHVCAGAPPAPGQEFIWSCAAPQTVACPKSAPKSASPCSVEGQVCTYGSCGREVATCKAGTWNVKNLPPPP